MSQMFPAVAPPPAASPRLDGEGRARPELGGRTKDANPRGARAAVLLLLALCSVTLLGTRGFAPGVFGGASPPTTREEKVQVEPMPEDPQIYFVHVGKTGGATVVHALLDLEQMIAVLKCRTALLKKIKKMASANFTLKEEACRDPVRNGNSSAFSKHVVGHLHKFGDQTYGRSWSLGKWKREWLLDHTDTFVYSVRDPVDRIVSAYNYHRHEGRWMGNGRNFSAIRDCFPDGVEQLAAAARHGGGRTSPPRCRGIAARLVRGLPAKGEKMYWWGAHFLFNYQYYAREALGKRSGRPVGVIRTEHLGDDVRRLDAALGGDGMVGNATARHTHGSDAWTGAFAYDNALSPAGRTTLCCLLRDELAAYQDLVLRAFNLDEEQKRDTVTRVLEHCRIKTSPGLPELPFSWSKFYNDTCLGSMLA